MKSEHFGTLLMMEVGALMVGKIENHPVCDHVDRGQEKGKRSHLAGSTDHLYDAERMRGSRSGSADEFTGRCGDKGSDRQ